MAATLYEAYILGTHDRMTVVWYTMKEMESHCTALEDWLDDPKNYMIESPGRIGYKRHMVSNGFQVDVRGTALALETGYQQTYELYDDTFEELQKVNHRVCACVYSFSVTGVCNIRLPGSRGINVQ